MNTSLSRGFTLIELLVVVSIIAMLAALLLPAIGTMRLVATKSMFASNQRQIGLAFLAYAQENHGRTIWGAGPGATSTEQWQALWFCVLSRDYLELEIPNNPTHAEVMKSVFHDPIDRSRCDYPGYADRAVYNVAIVGRTSGASGPSGSSNRNLSAISRQSEHAMLVPGPSGTVAPTPYAAISATEWGYSNRYSPWSWINGTPSLYLRYRGSGPCTFLDGHVESVDSTTFWAELTKDRFSNPAVPASNSRMFDIRAVNP